MKKLLCLLLPLLLLTGCSFRTATYSSATEPEKPDTEFRRETIYYHVLYDVTTEYADGRTEAIHYTFGDGKTYAYGEHYLDRRPVSAEFEEDGELVRTEEYIRDESGNITAIIPDGDDSKAQRFELTYDENGNIIQRLVTGGSSEADKEVYAYDGQNRVCELSEYSGGQLLRRTETVYAENGYVDTVTVYDANGAVTLLQKYTLNEDGYSETVLEYDGDGTLLSRREKGHNVDHLVVSEEVYDAEDNLLYSIYSRYSTGSYSYLVEE